MVNNKESIKRDYIDLLKSCASLPESDEKSLLMEKYLDDYYLYCYYNDLDYSFKDLIQLIDKAYIMPSTPNLTNIAYDEVRPIVEQLKNDPKVGISEEDAHTLLKYVVQNARNIMGNDCDITTSSLLGKCGYGQALTMIPLEQIGVKTTVNNTFSFPNCNSLHAFGTATLPVIAENGVVDKIYLLDVTYRQFYSSIAACYGRYFILRQGKRTNNTPLHGYHMVRYPNGKNIANQLLKDGYIELTPEVLKAYGTCFALQSLPYDELDKRNKIMAVDSSEYAKSLEKQEEYVFDSVQIMDIVDRTALSTSTLKR